MPVSPDTVTLYGANGEPASLPHDPLTADEIALLVAYKKFLHRHQYREALYCSRCFAGNRDDGCAAQVQTDGLSVEVMVRCRCRVAYGKGSTV